MTRSDLKVINGGPRQDVPQVHIQLDLSNDVHKAVWQNHLRFSGVVSMYEAMKASPFAVLTVPILAGFVKQFHEMVWNEFYVAFPELKDIELLFDVEHGIIRNETPDDKNNKTLWEGKL